MQHSTYTIHLNDKIHKIGTLKSIKLHDWYREHHAGYTDRWDILL